MDDRDRFLILIDRLDDLIHNAKSVPLTDQIRVDREEVYSILDEMRALLPTALLRDRLPSDPRE